MIVFSLNGRRIEVEDAPPTTTLLQYLRYGLGLTGTKEGCAEGDCGACTVVAVDRKSRSFRAINSCLVLLPSVHGEELYSVEGLGGFHPVQDSLVENLGSQCGYCTPGIIMSMFEACYRSDLDESWKVDDQMCGNLCRCTGYRPIRDATQAIAGSRPDDPFRARLDRPRPSKPELAYEHASGRFYQPASFERLFALLDRHPDAHLVAGGTDLVLRVTKRFEELQTVVSLEAIESLETIEPYRGGLSVGATVRLSDLETAAKAPLPAVERMLRFFGSRQIKNRGTVGGNLCNASPIGDLPPILLALDAKVVVRSRRGVRELPLDQFFLDYRKTALGPGEILERVLIPGVSDRARVTAYKVSKRQELDISAVAAGLLVEVDDGVVTRARFAYGGMAATPKRAVNAERAVVGRPWTEATVEGAARALDRDFTPIDDHRGSAWYRQTVAKNLLRGFFFETEQTPSPRHRHRPTGTLEVRR